MTSVSYLGWYLCARKVALEIDKTKKQPANG